MKYFILLGIFVLNSAIAVDYEKHMQESKAINSKFCALKVEAACRNQVCQDDPAKCSETPDIPVPKFSQNQKEELAKVKPDIDKCGQDMLCIAKVMDQAAQKELGVQKEKCKAGDQATCYYVETYEHSKKLTGI